MNTVEILIRARDEASRTLKAAIDNLQLSVRAFGEGTDKVAGSGQRLDTSLARTTRSARIFGSVLLADLSPGLAQLVMNMRLATESARLAETSIGAIAGTITGVALAAVAAYVSATIQATARQAELNLAVRSFDASRLRSELASIAKELETSALNWETVGKEVTGFSGLMQNVAAALAISAAAIANLFKGAPEERAKALGKGIAVASAPEHTRNLLQQQQAWIQLETGISAAQVKAKGFVDEQDRLDRVLIRGIEREKATAIAIITEEEKIAVAKAKAIGDTLAAAQASEVAAGRRVEAEQKAELAIANLTATAAARKRLFLETGISEERILEQRRHATRLALMREALDGERALLSQRLDLVARHGKEEGEQIAAGIAQGFMALEDQVGTFGQRASTAVQGTGRAMFRSFDDSFFSAVTGRFNDLPDIARRAGEEVLRELISVFTGPLKRSVVQSIAELFGARAGPGFSPATLAAAVPGGPVSGAERLAAGFHGATFAGFRPGPGFGAGEEAAAGLPGSGEAGLGSGQFFGGAAMLGLGALGILGASQAQDPLSGALSGGLGGLSVGLGLAALGLGASAFLGPIGLIGGLAFGLLSGSSSRRKRKREEARRRRAAAQIALIEQADTLEELEVLSVIGLEPEAAAALRQRATALVLEAGRQEIAGTRSLSGIRAILARGVSPDVGGAELRLEALRREQEILGGLEAIGGISIDEQLEGGVRRRTVVGAGPFGLARIGPGASVTAEASRIRRMIRMMLLEDQALREELMRRMRADAKAIDFRIGDLDALS